MQDDYYIKHSRFIIREYSSYNVCFEIILPSGYFENLLYNAILASVSNQIYYGVENIQLSSENSTILKTSSTFEP